MTAEKRYSPRGFRIYHDHESADPLNRTLQVRQSSVYSIGGVRLGTYPVRIYGGLEEDGHVHLSLEQAWIVRDALTTYIEEADEEEGA